MSCCDMSLKTLHSSNLQMPETHSQKYGSTTGEFNKPHTNQNWYKHVSGTNIAFPWIRILI